MSGVIMQGFAILLVCASVGCSAVSDSSQAELTKSASVAQIPVAQARPSVSLLDKVVWNAQKQQGKMYRWGGTSPVTGFDCSGLTQYAFKNGARVAIPRTAAEQYAAAVKVAQAHSQKGDLVFFNTSGRRVSHVGIYLGNGKFVHAPRTGRAIATDELKGYWAKRLVGFGRIPGACKPSYS
ncbi:MAG: glycoside hydrolase [Thiothrix lacustris]|uniref:Glycoside hydrolase n=1 Tax=Thiothrix lacustris TaxID=525917 RepID=A0A1Y1QNC4_9GAMM|nr:MAG: glycoside hydrolase [Thiothrix lacustris]